MAFLLVNFSLPALLSLEHVAKLRAPINEIALAVGCAMSTAILVAGVLGIVLPFSFRRLGVDPAIASGPLVTTLNDVVSVGIYMTIAMAIIG